MKKNYMNIPTYKYIENDPLERGINYENALQWFDHKTLKKEYTMEERKMNQKHFENIVAMANFDENDSYPEAAWQAVNIWNTLCNCGLENRAMTFSSEKLLERASAKNHLAATAYLALTTSTLIPFDNTNETFNKTKTLYEKAIHLCDNPQLPSDRKKYSDAGLNRLKSEYMTKLGALYEQGASPNIELARQWYEKAIASHGNSHALARLKQLKREAKLAKKTQTN